MANPSTQAPSNATTTNIIFSRDFAQSSYTLLEVPKALQSYIDGTSDEELLSFQVRGLETDTAVLCTPTQTFNLQRAHTSNMLVPIAPIIRQRRRSIDMDTDMDTDVDDPYHVDHKVTDDSLYEKQVVLDILDSVLDLVLISPRLERLADLLGQCPFEGWSQETNVKGPLYTWADLQSIIQASDKEILQWLKEKHACLIEGHWRLFRRRFMYDILKEVLMALPLHELTVEAIHLATLSKSFEEGMTGDDTEVEPWMVEHCVKSFSEDEPAAESGVYRLSRTKVCTFMGVHLLSTIGRGQRWKLEEFMEAWSKALDGQFQPDLAFLAGECFVEAERGLDRKQMVTYIRYFSKNNLPTDPAARFVALFEIKPKWEALEIRPFLRDLVLDEKKLDVLLLKHARSVKHPAGGVTYSSRVIK